jgi:hypothetical protein
MGGLGSLLHGMTNFLPGKLVESADISRRHLFGDRAAPAYGQGASPGRGGAAEPLYRQDG